MKDDPLRRELLDELRVLRRGAGALGIERVALSGEITDFVGHGSTDQAYTRLLDILDREGTDPEGDIRAFFETAGYDSEGANLDERLKHYAATHHVDQRTALRRSDRGAEKLSYILRDDYQHDRPWVNVPLVQQGAVAAFKVSVHMPSHMMWRRPHVYINGEFQEGLEFELHDDEEVDGFVVGQESFGDIPLDVSVDENSPLIEIDLVWIMPVWSSWYIGAHIADPRLYAKLLTSRDHRATIGIVWADEAAAATRDDPLQVYRSPQS